MATSCTSASIHKRRDEISGGYCCRAGHRVSAATGQRGGDHHLRPRLRSPTLPSRQGGRQTIAVRRPLCIRLAHHRHDDAPDGRPHDRPVCLDGRSEEHTSELQSLMRISYAVFCLKKKQITKTNTKKPTHNYYNSI